MDKVSVGAQQLQDAAAQVRVLEAVDRRRGNESCAHVRQGEAVHAGG